MNPRLPRWITPLILGLTLACAGVFTLPDDADAKRMGGGSSFGSRGTRSFSAPKQAPTSTSREAVAPTQQNATAPQQNATPSPAAPSPSRGFMGGLGGFLMGGLLGSLLFGGMGGMGSGLLDILLIGGLIFLALRFFRARQAGRQQSQPAQAAGTPYQTRETVEPTFGHDAPPAFGSSVPVTNADPEAVDLENGLALIAAMDPRFSEKVFLEGARICFERVQESWSSGNMDRLVPLLTPRMLEMARQQARELEEAGQRTVVDKVRILTQEVSEVWQESGEDWITVHFVAEMVDYLTDLSGHVVDGDPNSVTQVEEYWTFTRPTGSPDPNWRLSAIQQPGETARSAW